MNQNGEFDALFSQAMDSVSEVNIDLITASMDMQMLMGTKGRERTLSEWKRLLNDTGFNIESLTKTGGTKVPPVSKGRKCFFLLLLVEV